MESNLDRFLGFLHVTGALVLIGFVFWLGYATLMSIDVNMIEQTIRNMQSSQTNY